MKERSKLPDGYAVVSDPTLRLPYLLLEATGLQEWHEVERFDKYYRAAAVAWRRFGEAVQEREVYLQEREAFARESYQQTG